MHWFQRFIWDGVGFSYFGQMIAFKAFLWAAALLPFVTKFELVFLRFLWFTQGFWS